MHISTFLLTFAALLKRKSMNKKVIIIASAVLAFLAYDSCLVYKQNDAMVLNNYAYYLSLKQKDLKRAEEMSRLSNELEPDNATYLDTYAWVLFQQKRYEEAKQYMDKVVELMERDGEEMSDDVLDHIKQINKKVKKK